MLKNVNVMIKDKLVYWRHLVNAYEFLTLRCISHCCASAITCRSFVPPCDSDCTLKTVFWTTNIWILRHTSETIGFTIAQKAGTWGTR